MNYTSMFLNPHEIELKMNGWGEKTWNQFIYQGVRTMDYRPVDQVEVNWINAIRKYAGEWPSLLKEKMMMERNFDLGKRTFLEPQAVKKTVSIQAVEFIYDEPFSFTIWAVRPMVAEKIKQDRICIFISDSSLIKEGPLTFRQWDQQMNKKLHLMQLSAIGQSDWLGMTRALNEKNILQATIQSDETPIFDEQQKKQKQKRI